MKVVILAGGFGTRISEESYLKPKPLIEIGGMPIIWHIMKIYSFYGFNDFVICAGYKASLLKEFFYNYSLHTSDITIDIEKNNVEFFNKKNDPWKISIIDTGLNTQTGGRLKRVSEYLNETFLFTYGDGIGDININSLLKHHKSTNSIATVTGVRPEGRYGSLKIENEKVVNFLEKPDGDNLWINGGFFVFEPKVFDYIDGDDSVLERSPLEKISKDGLLSVFKHFNFWHSMDTLRDKEKLNSLWENKNAKWKIWN